MREKFKSLLASDQVFYSILVILVGFGGFFLGGGRAVAKPAETLPVVLPAIAPSAQPAAALVTQAPAVVAPGAVGMVVGSKSGTKYHLPSCPGAKQIKPENRIEFATIELAVAAGYKPAANCPGLVQ
jgi:hypothetical protein